jgi:hypothetical protein
MMMLTTHGLFLTCTQNSIFIFIQHIINFLGKTPYPLVLKVQGKPHLLGRPMSSHSGESLTWFQLPSPYFPISPHPLPSLAYTILQ